MYPFSPEIVHAHIDDLTRNARRARLVAAARAQRHNKQTRTLAVRLWRKPAPAAA